MHLLLLLSPPVAGHKLYLAGLLLRSSLTAGEDFETDELDLRGPVGNLAGKGLFAPVGWVVVTG